MKSLISLAILVFAASAAAQTSTVPAKECVRVTTVAATLRGKPSLTGKALDIITRNTQLQSIARRDTWVLVQSEEYAGWVQSNSIEPCVGGTISTGTELGASQGTEAANLPLTVLQPAATDSRIYTRGPRGGCYYTNSSGRKVYVNHSLCN
jgi:hypothetical protein